MLGDGFPNLRCGALMALVKCVDCGRDVSTLAKVCPNCGRPVDNVPVSVHPKKWPIIGFVGIIIVSLTAIIFNTGEQRKTEAPRAPIPIEPKGEMITASRAIGCPSIEAYQKYAEIAMSGDASATLQAAADLNCRMMLKGDKVRVVEWKMSKNLVRVHPEGNSMMFWLPGEFVSYSDTASSTDSERSSIKLYTGKILELEPFVVKIPDPKGAKYVKLKIAMEFESNNSLKKATGLAQKITEKFTLRMYKASAKEIMTNDGKKKLKSELIQVANSILEPDIITDLYFQEFIVQ